MPSSISSSEPTGVPVTVAPARREGYARAIVLSLPCFAFLQGLLEVGIRVAYDRVSRIGKRSADEYAAARSIAPAKPGEPPAILVAGNSLLDAGVDFPDLQQKMAGEGARV